MIGSRMLPSWVSFIVLLLCFTLNHDVSEARLKRHRRSDSVVVVGVVYCDTCFHQHFPKSSHSISGALLVVECGHASKPRFREEVKTDEKGEFRVKLPFSISKHVRRLKGCSVKLISSSEPYCAVASTANSTSIRLKSKEPGTSIFSAGFFTFKPLKQPELCNQKPGITNELNTEFPPTLPDPPTPFLPPIGEGVLPDLPNLPPMIPPLPRVPGIPIPPVIPEKDSKPKSDDMSDEKTFGLPIPPNPFNPPSLLPPFPFPFQPPPASVIPPILPSPPPSLIPPIIPSPPSSLLPPFPSVPVPPLVPGLIPSPPPPPPAFPIPLPPFPPFPFQPSPGFPGIPPAASSSKKTSP